MAHAHGKVIILGEHAVVYGYPAIAAGISKGAEAWAERSEKTSLQVDGQSLVPGRSPVARALDALLDVFGSPKLAIRVSLSVPAGCGLGASAAMGVAIARAAAELLQTTSGKVLPDRKRIQTATIAWEKVFHGNPSGVDAAAAELGGCIEYTRQNGATPLRTTQSLALAIAVAGPPASTKRMVEGLAAKRRAEPLFVNARLAQIGDLVLRGRSAICSGDVRHLGQLLNDNHTLLAQLGLSTDSVDRTCELAIRTNALGAKLTGAGGGGCVIALAQSDPEPILRAWKAAGIECFAAAVAAPDLELQP